MRKTIYVFANLLLAVMAFALLVSCSAAITQENEVENSVSNDSSFNASAGNVHEYKLPEISAEVEFVPEYEPRKNDTPVYVQEICECSLYPDAENLREWTIEELGEIIVESGNFWNDWWMLRGRFAWAHTGAYDWDKVPRHLVGFYELLPTSGFENLNDIREYLLQFYTEAWVDIWLANEFFPFVEYDNVLYFAAGRSCSGRSDWNMSSHTLIDQDGCHALVESTVLFVCGESTTEDGYSYISKGTHHFKFINGRISRTSECPVFASRLYVVCLEAKIWQNVRCPVTGEYQWHLFE